MWLTPEQLEEKLLDSKRTQTEIYEKMIDNAIKDGGFEGVSKEFLLEYAIENDGIDFEKENRLAAKLEEKFDGLFAVLVEIDIEEALKNKKDFVRLSIPNIKYDDYKLIMELSQKRHIEENAEGTEINKDIIKTNSFSNYLKRKGFNSYYSIDEKPNGYILDFNR